MQELIDAELRRREAAETKIRGLIARLQNVAREDFDAILSNFVVDEDELIHLADHFMEQFRSADHEPVDHAWFRELPEQQRDILAYLGWKDLSRHQALTMIGDFIETPVQ